MGDDIVEMKRTLQTSFSYRKLMNHENSIIQNEIHSEGRLCLCVPARPFLHTIPYSFHIAVIFSFWEIVWLQWCSEPHKTDRKKLNKAFEKDFCKRVQWITCWFDECELFSSVHARRGNKVNTATNAGHGFYLTLT